MLTLSTSYLCLPHDRQPYFQSASIKRLLLLGCQTLALPQSFNVNVKFLVTLERLALAAVLDVGIDKPLNRSLAAWAEPCKKADSVDILSPTPFLMLIGWWERSDVAELGSVPKEHSEPWAQWGGKAVCWGRLCAEDAKLHWNCIENGCCLGKKFIPYHWPSDYCLCGDWVTEQHGHLILQENEKYQSCSQFSLSYASHTFFFFYWMS